MNKAITTTRRRAKRLSPEQRTSDIEKAARQIFSERDYDDVSIAEIAAEANVAEGTIYKYFENKRDLMIKVLEHWYQSMISDYIEHVDAIQGAQNKIRYIIWRHLKSLKENADLCRLSYSGLKNTAEYFDSSIYEYNREYTKVFVDACREGIASGELRQDLPIPLLRDLVFGGVDHIIVGFLFNQRDFDVNTSTEQIVGLLFKGIETRADLETKKVESLEQLSDLAERFQKLLDRADQLSGVDSGR